MKTLVTKLIRIQGAKILLSIFGSVIWCATAAATEDLSDDIKSHSPLNIEINYGSELRLGVNLAAGSKAKVVWADDTGKVLCKKTHCQFQKKVRSLGQVKVYAVIYRKSSALYLKFNITVKQGPQSPAPVVTPAHVPYIDSAQGSGSAELDLADSTGKRKRARIYRKQSSTASLQKVIKSGEQTLQIADSGGLKLYLLPESIIRANQMSGRTSSLSLVEGSVRGVIGGESLPELYIAVDDWLIVKSADVSDIIVTRGSNAVVTIKTLQGRPEIFYLPTEETPSAGLKKMSLPAGTQVLAIRGTKPFVHSDPTLEEWPREESPTQRGVNHDGATEKSGAGVLAELHSLFDGDSPVTPASLDGGKPSERESAKASAVQIVSRVADSLLDDSLSIRTGSFSFRQTGAIAEQGDSQAEADGTIGLSNLNIDINRHFSYGFARTLSVRYVYDTDLGRLRYFAGGLGLRWYPRGGYPEGLAQLREYDAEYRSFRPYVEGSFMLGQFLIGSAFGNVAVFSSDFAGVSLSAGSHYHITKSFALDVSAGFEQDQGIGEIEFGSQNQYFSLGLLKYH